MRKRGQIEITTESEGISARPNHFSHFVRYLFPSFNDSFCIDEVRVAFVTAFLHRFVDTLSTDVLKSPDKVSKEYHKIITQYVVGFS